MTASTETRAAGRWPVTAEQTIIDLARAMKNTSFYEVGHPVVQEVLAEVGQDLEALLEERPELSMRLIGGYLVVQDMPLVSQHASVGNLIGACHRRGAESIVFHRGVTTQEVQELVALLAADPGAVQGAGGMARALSERGVRRISVERLRLVTAKDWRWTHSAALDVMRDAAGKVRRGHSLDVSSIRWNVHEIVDNVLGDRAIVYSLNSMKGMDEYTFIHALHLCVLAVELGRQIGLARSQLEELGICTLLHDVGKIFVPLEILRKPAALDDAEFALMSRHPVDGAAVLAGQREVPEVAAVVAFEHHVHIDYSGYPKIRGPRPLHMYSLMASVADVYDALTTNRPYRPALPPHRALEVIREQYAGRLEPTLVPHFLRMLGPYPWGTLLRISDGRYALITRPNPEDPADPFARVVDVSAGAPVSSAEQAPLSELGKPERMEIVDPIVLGIDLTRLLRNAEPGANGESRQTTEV